MKTEVRINESRNMFGLFGYSILVLDDNGRPMQLINGTCDDFEVIGKNVSLYYGDSMQQVIFGASHGYNVEVILFNDDGGFRTVYDYCSFDNGGVSGSQ